MTLAEKFIELADAEAEPFIAKFGRLGQVAYGWRNKVTGKLITFTTNDSNEEYQTHWTYLGCKGETSTGKLAWILWDLDVGHGNPKQKYETTEEAIAVARTIRDALNGHAEIRLSTGGTGVHVCHLLPDDSRPAADGAKIAKALTAKLNLRCDRTVLGRQVRWLWTANPNPNSFKLIEAHA